MKDKQNPERNRIIVIDQSIEELATVVVDYLSREVKDRDPFDEYSRLKKQKLYFDLYNFKHRFMHGYEVLLRELNKRESE